MGAHRRDAVSEIWPELTDTGVFERCLDSEKRSELQEAFDSLDAADEDYDDAQNVMTLCDIVNGVDSAVTLYLNGPTMILVALIVGGTALMIAIVAPNGEPWQYTCCEYRPRYPFCNVV